MTREQITFLIQTEAKKAGYGPKVVELSISLTDEFISEDPWEYIFVAVRIMVNEARSGL